MSKPQRVLSPLEYDKKTEKYKLGKIANGVGAYLLSYYLSMQIVAIFMVLILNRLNLSSEAGTIVDYLLDILISVMAAFIPGLFYFLFSHKKMTTLIPTKHTKLTTLIPLLFIGLAVAMIANSLSDLMLQNFSLFGIENHANFSTTTNSVGEFLLCIVSTAIVPAFAEEFAFRGIIMGSLRKYGDAFAIVSSAILFGTMHGNISQIPFALTLGLIFGYVDCKTDSIYPSVIIHFANNFYAVLFDTLLTSTSVDKTIGYSVYFGVIVAFVLIGLLSFIYIAKTDKSFFKMRDSEPTWYPNSNLISFKEKNKALFLSPAIIISLIIFLIEAILYMIPFS